MTKIYGKLEVHSVYKWGALDNVKAKREIQILNVNKSIDFATGNLLVSLKNSFHKMAAEEIVLNWWKREVRLRWFKKWKAVCDHLRATDTKMKGIFFLLNMKTCLTCLWNVVTGSD